MKFQVNVMSSLLYYLASVGLLVLFQHAQEVVGLRNVTLKIEPEVVLLGEYATFTCCYDLQGAPLYTVKWYRGNREFYRYSPGEVPKIKVFPYTGIYVDLNMSNSSQVVLRKIGFFLSGNFSCEVSADAPSFSTMMVSRRLLVVELPDSPPTLMVEKQRYDHGDVLRANCSSPPSTPRATLTFILNNIAVAMSDENDILYMQDSVPNAEWSSLSLELPLFPSHFTSGRLLLRCVAQVAGHYHFNSEIQLASAREPVPERVTLWSSSAVSKLGPSAVVVICNVIPLLVLCIIRFMVMKTT